MFADAQIPPESGPSDSFVWLGVSWLILTGFGGGVVWAMRRWLPSAQGRLLPPQRQRAVPWEITHIGLLLCLLFLEESLIASLFNIRRMPVAEANQAESAFRTFLSSLVARPLEFLTILYLLRVHAGAQLYQLGLTLHRWGKDVVCAFRLWLGITPVVYLISMAALLVEQPDVHPVAKLLSSEKTLLLWFVTAVAVILLAPVFEEFLFRGVLQAWLVRVPLASDLVVVGFLLFAVVWGSFYPGIWPAIFLVGGGGGYLLAGVVMRRWLPQPATRAIFASALLFAVIHANVWPSPMPIFFLALGLGWLAYRTQSIIGPIVAHALFNALSSLALLMQ